MVNIKVSRVIDAEPRQLWNLVTEPARLHEWLPGVVEARPVKKRNGTKTLGRQQVLKTRTELGVGESIQEVIAWEPPKRVAWQHVKDILNGKEQQHSRDIKTTFSINIVDGEVSIRMIGSWQPYGISGRVMNRAMKRVVHDNLERALDNLAHLVTQETAPV